MCSIPMAYAAYLWQRDFVALYIAEGYKRDRNRVSVQIQTSA
jgi:hypothetical protein